MLLKSGLNYQRLIKQVFIGVGASLCLASLTEAAGVNSINGNASSNLRNSHSIEIAHSRLGIGKLAINTNRKNYE